MGSFLHTTAWQRFQEAMGAATLRAGNNLYLERSIPRSSYFLCSRCQLEPGFTLPDFAKLPCFLRYEPIDEASLSALRQFAKTHSLSLRPTLAVQPRQSVLVDISGNEEEILQNMKQKHRYNIRLAQKKELQVHTYSQNLKAEFGRFWTLLSSTAERQDFRTHSREYYETMLIELEKDGLAHIVLVSMAHEDLAGMILITHEGTATYLHGATSLARKELMAPYLMHFSAIQMAKQLGCSTYDLWGIHAIHNQETNEWEPIPGHPSAGTSRIKLGFGGTVVNYPGSFDLVLQPLWYRIYETARKIRGGKRAFS